MIQNSAISVRLSAIFPKGELSLRELGSVLRYYLRHSSQGRKVWTWVLVDGQGNSIKVARMPYIERLTVRADQITYDFHRVNQDNAYTTLWLRITPSVI